MSNRSVIRWVSVSTVVTLLMMTVSPIYAKAPSLHNDSLRSGPYVDKLLYKTIPERVNQMLAILNDDIDLVHEKLDPARNGYGVLYINSAKYPLNITAFRRAFAFALDKHKICENVWEGMANPQDSVVPSGNPWTIEGLLPYSYYEGNVELGRQLLDSAGFSDFDGDGWLDAPNGDPFNVV
ncbi:MAG: ABC transporter substrate-binding protein, partial [Candidatus Thorarchaeota archaeon]